MPNAMSTKPSSSRRPQKQKQNDRPKRSSGRREAVTLAACRRCRQRHIRCDGERPSCHACLRVHETCDYGDIGPSESRKEAAARQERSLHSQLREIVTRLGELQRMPHAEAAHWFSVIRGAPDPVAALCSLRSCPTAPPSGSAYVAGSFSSSLASALESCLAAEHPGMYRYPLSAKLAAFDVPPAPAIHVAKDELCDVRLSRLDIGFWTSVPVPDEFAAQAISSYLRTDHPLLAPFDPELFVTDLVARRSRFCTALLVNAVLSWACRTLSVQDPTAGALAESFHAAAVRLLGAEQDNDSVMNVAALFCLSLGSVCAGNESAAQQFQVQSLKMAVSLRLVGEDGADALELGLFDPEVISAFSYVAWAVYNFAWVHTFHYRTTRWATFANRAPRLSVPGKQGFASDWMTFKAPPGYIGHTFQAYCEFFPISQEILSVYMKEQESSGLDVPLAFAEERYQKLLVWADNLDPSVHWSETTPHHVAVLHASFHSTVVELFRPFLHKGLRLSQSTTLGARPEDIFLFSSMRLPGIARYYCSAFQGTTFMNSILWFVVPVYTAYISAKGNCAPWQERRQDFRMCIEAYMNLAFPLPLREGIVRGSLTMAVGAKLFSPDESRHILQEVLGSTSHGSSARPRTGTELVVDFDHGRSPNQQSRVSGLAAEFDSTMRGGI